MFFLLGPNLEGINIENVRNTEMQSVSLAKICTLSSRKMSLRNRTRDVVTVQSCTIIAFFSASHKCNSSVHLI